MNDLKTQEGRIAAIKAIEESFIQALRNNLIEVAPDALCRMRKESIELGIISSKNKNTLAFASEIDLYAKGRNANKINEINFGSSGSFTPEDRASYWRTIHAASILKNWKVACSIVNKHCRMYAEL